MGKYLFLKSENVEFVVGKFLNTPLHRYLLALVLGMMAVLLVIYRYIGEPITDQVIQDWKRKTGGVRGAGTAVHRLWFKCEYGMVRLYLLIIVHLRLFIVVKSMLTARTTYLPTFHDLIKN